MISMGLFFWIIMLIVLLFWGFQYRDAEGKWNFAGFGGSLVLWVLLAILGWKIFGPPLGH